MNNNFCEIHKSSIAISRCTKCSRNICRKCAIDSSSFCPKCRGTNILKKEKKGSQNEIRNILITGFILSLISILINILTDNSETISQNDLILNCLFYFSFGISIASAIYFVRKTDVFDDIQEIPLLGIKIIKYIVLISSFFGLPIIYFGYLIYKFIKKVD